MRALWLLFCLEAALFVVPSFCECAEDTPSGRPKIGLVLSGGGARGAAHAGVVKVLEELRVPADFVVGTSMGAIVGGLYAAGVSPADIDSSLRAVDWDDLFDDSPPRGRLPFRRKEEDREQLFRFEFGLGRKGLTFPRGLIAGQKLGFLLAEMAPSTACLTDFDGMAIPFRAVATDLDTGEMVVLSTGTLGEAMRASMAVPGMFTPVESEGRTLIDGGIVRSLPVDVARSMGADVVIAVDVSPGAHPPERPSSALGIVLQTLYLLLEQNVPAQREALGGDDVLIIPELGSIWVADFPMSGEAIAAGERAARSHADELRRYAVSEAEYRAFVERVQGAGSSMGAPAMIDAIEVAGLSRVSPGVVRAAMRTRVGSPLDPEVLLSDLESTYELGDFERVGFRVSEQAGLCTLTVDAREKSWGPNFLRFGLSIESDLRERSTFTARASHLRTRINPRGAEWRTLIQLGEEARVFTEFTQPLDLSGTWFVSPWARWDHARFDVFEGGVPRADLLAEKYECGLDAGIQLRNHGEIRAGVFRGTDDVDVRLGPPDLGTARRDVGGYVAGLTVDQMDSPSFPRRGTLASLEGTFQRADFGAERSYQKIQLDAQSAVSLGNHTLLGVLELGSAFGSDVPLHEQFDLGGFLRLSGLARGELRGPNAGLGEVAYYYRLVRLPGPIGRGVFVGASLEAGNVWVDRTAVARKDLRSSASLFVGADSVLGPACLALGWGDGGTTSAHLSIGGAFRGR